MSPEVEVGLFIIVRVFVYRCVSRFACLRSLSPAHVQDVRSESTFCCCNESIDASSLATTLPLANSPESGGFRLLVVAEGGGVEAVTCCSDSL